MARKKKARGKKASVKVAYRQKESLLPEQDFFRRIEYPHDFRRNLLEGSKSALSALKGVYAVKEIRQKKLQKLLELQSAVREIRLLIQKAEELMPKYTKHQAIRKFPQLAPPKPKKEKKAKKEKPVPAPKPKPVVPVQRQRSMSELDKLSASIDKIESKIKSLPNEPARPKKKKPEAPKDEGKPAAKEDKKPEAKPAPAVADDLGVELGKALDKIHAKLKEL